MNKWSHGSRLHPPLRGNGVDKGSLLTASMKNLFGMNLNERLLEEAEGYLELELPEPALEALAKISAEGKLEQAFSYHSYSGEALRVLERYEEAIPHFEAALADRSEEVGLYINLAWCLKRNNQLDQATETLLQAEQVCRKANDMRSLALVLYNLSCYYSLASNKERMLHCLRAALLLAPNFLTGIKDETDFDPWRNDPDFVEIASAKT